MMKKLFTLTLSLLIANYSTCVFGSQFPLHDAAKAGDVNQVQELLERIDVNAKDNNGNTPLHVAVRFDRLEIFQALVADSRCNINEKDNNGWTPLHYAVVYKNHEMFQALLADHRCNFNEKDGFGKTLLHIVILCGKMKIFQTLLADSRCTSINAKDNEGKSLLHYAVIYKRLEALQALLAHRHCNIYAKDSLGNTSLDYAKGYNTEIEELIIHRDDFIKGLALSYSKSILLCNHPRCGAESQIYGLPSHVQQSIHSYLHPEACAYSHEEEMRYIAMARTQTAQAPTLTPTAPAQAPTATTQTAPATATAQATATATATATSQQSTVQTVLNYCSIQ